MSAVDIKQENILSNCCESRHSGHLQCGIHTLDAGLPKDRSAVADQWIAGMTDGMSLQDLFVSGGVQPGFYVASGTRDLVPFVLDRLVGFLQSELETTSNNSSQASQVGKLLWIDSGNYFDPYRMALTSVRRGLNPTRILRAIQVARPFTAFQFQQMLEKVPKPVLLKVQGPNRMARLVWRRPLVILSDLLKLFYDEEIQENDVNRAYRDFLIRLSFLKKRAIVVGLHIIYPTPRKRVHFLEPLLSFATRLTPRLSDVMPARKSA